jgi:hypothetical protein
MLTQFKPFPTHTGLKHPPQPHPAVGYLPFVGADLTMTQCASCAGCYQGSLVASWVLPSQVVSCTVLLPANMGMKTRTCSCSYAQPSTLLRWLSWVALQHVVDAACQGAHPLTCSADLQRTATHICCAASTATHSSHGHSTHTLPKHVASYSRGPNRSCMKTIHEGGGGTDTHLPTTGMALAIVEVCKDEVRARVDQT